jgi:hypothetical protein
MEYFERARIERLWAETVVAGQFVHRIRYRNWDLAEAIKITRTTKTLLILADGTRLKRSTLRDQAALAYSNTFYAPDCSHIVAEINAAKQAKIDKDAATALFARIELIRRNGHMTPRVVAELTATLERLGLTAP